MWCLLPLTDAHVKQIQLKFPYMVFNFPDCSLMFRAYFSDIIMEPIGRSEMNEVCVTDKI